MVSVGRMGQKMARQEAGKLVERLLKEFKKDIRIATKAVGVRIRESFERYKSEDPVDI